jgi:hypothetical protein
VGEEAVLPLPKTIPPKGCESNKMMKIFCKIFLIIMKKFIAQTPTGCYYNGEGVLQSPSHQAELNHQRKETRQ